MVDFEPKEGRYLLRKATGLPFYPWYEAGGRIVRVAGKRVYYKDSTGAEKFTHEYSGICDTDEEVKRLLAFTEEGKSKVEALRLELHAMEIDALTPPEAQVKRRVRKEVK